VIRRGGRFHRSQIALLALVAKGPFIQVSAG
jgi:hypothetical protein